MNLGNPVADLDHRADFGHGHAGVEILDLLPNDFTYFVRSDFVFAITSISSSFAPVDF